MKKYFLWIPSCLIFANSVIVAEDVYDLIISNFRDNKYYTAAGKLEDIKEKDAKIYYYLGLSYFKAGNKILAKKYFLYSYYLDPMSRWGRASYKNYMYLIRYEWRFSASTDIGYDSNVIYLTDEFISNDAGSFFAGMYFSSSYRFSTAGTLKYYYKRNEYFDDNFQDEDKHNLTVSLRKNTNELSVVTSYATLAGDYFYTALSGKYSGKVFNVSIMGKDYEKEYSYLDGYELSLSLYKNIYGFYSVYSYLYNNVKDISEPAYFMYVTASPDANVYDFEEIVSEDNYFIS
ncbi:hypothetical protein ACFLTD_03315, partial [Elusimicrobiota bacterium]